MRRPTEHSSPPDYARAVLDVVDAIPRGAVLAYGDVAARVGLRSARLVGQVMRRYGFEVPWHRVVMADGSPAPQQRVEQLARLRRDGTPLTADGRRVDMARARWTDGSEPQ